MSNVFNKVHSCKRKPRPYEEDYSKREHKAQIDEALVEYYANRDARQTLIDEANAAYDAFCAEYKALTIAEQIAQELDNDGQRWESSKGVSFAVLVYDQLPVITHHLQNNVVRYGFSDHSAIVETLHYWFVETKDRNIRTLCEGE
jgi:hypothetical protein